MKTVTFFVIITFLFASCKLEPNKTTEHDSLKSEKSKATAENSSTTLDIVKSTSNNTHYGIDISHWQGNLISAMSNKDKLSFIICKATGGDHYIDPDFRTNWRDIKAKGFIRGAYHFYLCVDNPKTQAEHFCATISDIGPNDIAPVLDIEQGSMSKEV